MLLKAIDDHKIEAHPKPGSQDDEAGHFVLDHIQCGQCHTTLYLPDNAVTVNR